MKKDIHPKYHKNAKVLDASSGETIEVGSTVENMDVEISHLSHPFYTGKEQLVDTAGRVDRFKQLVEKQSKVAATRTGKKAKRAKQSAQKVAKAQDEKPEVKKPLKEAKASDLESK